MKNKKVLIIKRICLIGIGISVLIVRITHIQSIPDKELFLL